MPDIRTTNAIGFNWTDIEARAHATAFTVAGILKQDILQDVRVELEKSLESGASLADFKKRLLPLLADKGWIGKGLKADTDGVLEGKKLNGRRLDTIFRTNMQSAFSAGKYQQQKENSQSHPYWQYVAVMDGATRPTHAALDGTTLRSDDAFWDTFYPPNGWGCRCTVRAFNERDIKNRNISVVSSQGKLQEIQQLWGTKGETRTVQAMKLPGGRLFTAEPGFAHNPGQSYLGALGQRLLERAATAAPLTAAVAVAQTLSNPLVMEALTTDVKKFVSNFRTDGQARGRLIHVGAMPQQVVNWLAKHQGEPQSAVISLTDTRLRHATRDVKFKPLPDSFWQELPTYIAKPQAVLYDKKDKNLVWVFDVKGTAGKVAIRTDYKTTVRNADNKGRESIITNNILTGSEAVIVNLKYQQQYELITGELDGR